MVHVNPNVVISMGKWLKSSLNTNHSAVFFHFVAMIIGLYTNKYIPDWCRWVIWYEEVLVKSGVELWLTRHGPPC
jgi:hypothetical protein